MANNTENVTLIYKIKDLASQQLEKFKNKADKADKSATSLGEKFNKLGMKAKIAAGIIGVALVAAIGKAIFEAAKFQQTLTNVYTLLSQDDFEKFGDDIEKGALAVMEKFGLATEDTNNALFDTISAGVQAGDSIKFLEQASSLAVGGVTSVSVAVDGMTSVMNAYGKEAFDATQTANVFFAAQKAGKTTVEELAKNIGKVAPVAKLAGLSFEETASALSTLTLSGMNTELAATSLKGILQGLINPSKEAEGALMKLNIPVGASEIKMAGLGGTLRSVNEAYKLNSDALAELFPNMEGLLGIAGLTGESLDKYDDILKSTKTDTTSLDSATKKQLGNFNTQLGIALAQIRVVGIQIMDVFLPALTGILNVFNKIPRPIKILLTVFVSLTATISLLVIGFVTMTPFIVAAGTAFVGLGISANMALFGIPALIALISTGIILLVSKITGLNDSLGSKLQKQLDKTSDKLKKTKQNIKDLYAERDKKIDNSEYLGGINNKISIMERSEADLIKKQQEIIAKGKKEEIDLVLDWEKKKADELAAQKIENDALLAAQKILDEEAELAAAKLLAARLLKIKTDAEAKALEAKKKALAASLEASVVNSKSIGDIALNLAKTLLNYVKKEAIAALFAKQFETMAEIGMNIARHLSKGFVGIPEAIMAASQLAVPAAQTAIGAGAINAIQLADGGSYMVDQPTMISPGVVAGEQNIPEQVDVTPISESGGSNGQTIVNVYLDGDKISSKLLKKGQQNRQEGFINDGLSKNF